MRRWLAILSVVSLVTSALVEAAENQPSTTVGERSGVKASVAAAESAPDKAKLKPTNPKTDTFEVEADKVDVYKNRGEAFFQGSVKAIRQDMIVKSDTLRMIYDNATKKVVKMTANGKVSIQWQDRNATCNQAVYMIDEKKMFLTGNVVMTRGEDRVACERFYVDMVKDVQSCQGGPGKRVKIKGNIGEGGLDFPNTAPSGSKSQVR